MIASARSLGFACIMRCLALALLLVVLVRPVSAQTPSLTDAAAFDLFNEAAKIILEKAYKTEPLPLFLNKALHGLVKQIGLSAKEDHAPDLRSLPEAEAQKAFEQEILAIAATPGQRLDTRSLVEHALQIWCSQHDPYTRYTPADEYLDVKRLRSGADGSVGMALNEKSGAFFCFPLPGSPAEAAGIKPGDKLLSVDGHSVSDHPFLEYLAGLIRGPAGEDVQLRVEHNFGRSQSFRIAREKLGPASVIAEKNITGTTLRVRHFTASTVAEARSALAGIGAGDTLTLDFRGCEGGLLNAGIEFTALFLDAGEPIVTLRQRGIPDEVRTASAPRRFKSAAFSILQDEGTASAAEMVIAALVNSPHTNASTQGTKTFGKGLVQDSIELKGGGRLILTTGELIAPQGVGWDGIGLLPSLENHGRIFAKK
jgi:carboxyl-terminal processing protease